MTTSRKKTQVVIVNGLGLTLSLILIGAVVWALGDQPNEKLVTNFWVALIYSKVVQLWPLIGLFAVVGLLISLILLIKRKQRLWPLILPVIASHVFCFGLSGRLWVGGGLWVQIDSTIWNGRWFHLMANYSNDPDHGDFRSYILYECEDWGMTCKGNRFGIGVGDLEPYLSVVNTRLMVEANEQNYYEYMGRCYPIWNEKGLLECHIP